MNESVIYLFIHSFTQSINHYRSINPSNSQTTQTTGWSLKIKPPTFITSSNILSLLKFFHTPHHSLAYVTISTAVG